MMIPRLLPLICLVAVVAASIPVDSRPIVPQIRDDSPDLSTSEMTYGMPEVDIVAAWFGNNATTLTVSVEVLNITHRVRSNEWINYLVGFRCGQDLVDIELIIAYVDGWPPYTVMRINRGDGSYDWRQGPIFIDGNVVRAEFPRDVLNCDALTETSATATLQFPNVGLISAIGTDFAPGDGHTWGDDYTMVNTS